MYPFSCYPSQRACPYGSALMPLLHTVSYIWPLEDPVEDSAPTDFHAFLKLPVRKIDSLTVFLVPSALEITLLQIDKN